jgi:hypothetical protein
VEFVDVAFQNNGATGNADGVVLNSGCLQAAFRRCLVQHIRGRGINNSGFGTIIHECEVTDCVQVNTLNFGAITLANGNAGATLIGYCYVHDNATQGVYGTINHPVFIANSIFDTNGGGGSGGYGVYMGDQGMGPAVILNCDFYNNVSGGMYIGGTFGGVPSTGLVQNCNFVKNGVFGIAASVRASEINIFNCGFGSGTQANTNGQITAGHYNVNGSVTYAANVTPWRDPANGDFTITLDAAKNAGRGAFIGATNTTGFPDIGAAQVRGGGISRARSVNQ